MKIKTDNILILADNNFTSIKEKVVKDTKIITKNWEYLTFVKSIKFNKIQIKLNSNSIILIK